MWVKVCGTTTAEDALLAVEAGADAVGFVLARVSRRHVGVAEVRAMVDRMMEAGGRAATVERVGVFDPNDYAAEGAVAPDGHVVGGFAGRWDPADLARVIAEDAQAAGLTGIQLHGTLAAMGVGLRELAGLVRRAAPEMEVVPVVNWAVDRAGEGERVEGEIRGLREVGLRRVLVDAKVGDTVGGTGQSFAWGEAANVLGNAGLAVIVAGGLRPETVSEAVRVLQPWGVDAVSGVEWVPRQKSAERVRAFVRAARAG